MRTLEPSAPIDVRLHGVRFLCLRQQRSQYGAETIRPRKIFPIDRNRGFVPPNEAARKFIAEVAGDRGPSDSRDRRIVEWIGIDSFHTRGEEKKYIVRRAGDSRARREGAHKK